MNIYPYERKLALEYAKKWAFSRNPKYYDFEKIGGDCTNFISQCVYAGCGVMNHTAIIGWYYYSLSSRAPAWTGVNEFYKFMINNNGLGPFATQSYTASVMPADIIQLSNGNRFYHTVIVTKIEDGEIYTASHTRDSHNKRLLDYSFAYARFLHIEGYRK